MHIDESTLKNEMVFRMIFRIELPIPYKGYQGDGGGQGRQDSSENAEQPAL